MSVIPLSQDSVIGVVKSLQARKPVGGGSTPSGNKMRLFIIIIIIMFMKG
jgi:hypothetical protein